MSSGQKSRMDTRVTAPYRENPYKPAKETDGGRFCPLLFADLNLTEIWTTLLRNSGLIDRCGDRLWVKQSLDQTKERVGFDGRIWYRSGSFISLRLSESKGRRQSSIDYAPQINKSNQHRSYRVANHHHSTSWRLVELTSALISVASSLLHIISLLHFFILVGYLEN